MVPTSVIMSPSLLFGWGEDMKRNKTTPVVAIIMGSVSDWTTMQQASELLEKFLVPFEVKILSAHRSPDETANYAKGAAKRGIKVLIAAAGVSAHLAGNIAAHTSLPVIGVPMRGGALDGLDALLSTIQMPAGVPVATVALGEAGAINSAILAAQILALSDAALARKLATYKKELREKVLKAERELRAAKKL